MDSERWKWLCGIIWLFVVVPLFFIILDYFDIVHIKTYTKFKFMWLTIKSISPVKKIPHCPFVEKQAVLELLDTFFDFRLGVGGVWVVYAPSGAGKTTLVTREAERHRNSGQPVVMLDAKESTKELYKYLNFPRKTSCLSEVLPDRSVIILDHFERLNLDSDARSMVLTLATDCCKTGKYYVLILISNAKMASTILSWNGGTKIKQLGKALNWKWDRAMVENYVKKCEVFRVGWKKKVLDRLVDMAELAGKPSVLQQLAIEVKEQRVTADTMEKEMSESFVKGEQSWRCGVLELSRIKL